ncbi:hypothetical protein CHL76_02435 [Marinococcus halophilus]|uniref:Uncharacterized protein n=1 Tax=Marinococcus halophilus TaxID=1371 RepID=A0A510Y1H9_MARHA|nr:hypothetical protein [Marinococcus halophilus]OZT81233.1 hypothetical protein CHL76_02435 [Marinococcus halophilus]GEK57172.1 hypothetical protein MHA01_00770 [Marinococcus halophilus]
MVEQLELPLDQEPEEFEEESTEENEVQVVKEQPNLPFLNVGDTVKTVNPDEDIHDVETYYYLQKFGKEKGEIISTGTNEYEAHYYEVQFYKQIGVFYESEIIPL